MLFGSPIKIASMRIIPSDRYLEIKIRQIAS
jgi:hypothetical protein